ncbi:MAG TPA: FAD:protein FMN transferase, partial [Bacilli bacterium]|nr:FAD:protein FMN transferase [Bacilli bacterium]
LLIIPLLFLCGCSKTNVETYNMLYMDTYIEVKLYDVDEDTANDLFSDIDNIYEEYDHMADRYTSYDNLINVYYLNNELDVNEEVEISSELSDLIEYGINTYNITDGYVNIAIGNLVDVWKSYREEGTSIPSLDELNNCGSNDINDIVLNGNTYMKTSDVKLDLGSYVKGYVTELVGNYLESKGYTKYLINAGGNVKVGDSYKDSEYIVGLEEPFNTSTIYKKIYVENESVVTSGSYQRYYEYDGVIYNHIINPYTLYPENYTKSVSVITEDSGYADVLSTYLFILPIEDGINIVNNLDNIEAIWYNDDIYYSEGFSNYE